jgi:hypothetical protein
MGATAISVGALLVARPAAAQEHTQTAGGEVVQQAMPVATRDLAAQLGVKPSVHSPDELQLGATLNGMLEEPERLAAFGLKGLHPGARVTAFRASPVKVILEVDEVDPAPLSKRAVLRIDERGRLVAP